jgi:chorismate mutase
VCVCVCNSTLFLLRKHAILSVFLFYSIGLLAQPTNADCLLASEDKLYYNIDYDDDMTEEKFYLKTRIFFLYEGAQPWLTSNDAETYAETMMEILNNTFNKYKIYFLDELGTCDYSNYAFHVSSGTNEAIANDPILINNNYINICVYNPNATPPSAYAFNAPNNFFKVSGTVDQTLHALTPTIIHEMGHLFGLLHTHEDSCDDDPLCNDLCTCTGDFVCDTPVNTTDPLPCEDELGRNYMSYATSVFCQDYFTPEQVQRMRAYLAQSAILQASQADITTLIDDPTDPIPTISGDIIITSGTDYVIDNTEIQMLPGASITIETGASLDIKNGTKITGACGQMWEGIIVEGNYAQPQSPTDQGKLIVRGATTIIENAICAIQTEENQGGGIIEVLGATLSNNTIGIKFSSYLQLSQSEIEYANFSITDDYIAEEAPIHVDIDQLYGLSILRTKFLDERSSCGNINQKPIGIKSTNGSFSASSCRFENLWRGVVLASIQELPSELTLHRNQFEKCVRGIMTMESSSFQITNNDFDIMPPDHCNPNEIVGVYMTGSTSGYELEENDFFNSAITDDYIAIGTKSTGTGDGMDNNIKLNTFGDLHYGNWVEGDNGSEMAGLIFTCNTYNDMLDNTTYVNSQHIRVVDGATVAMPQDDTNSNGLQVPTGNLFVGYAANDIYSGTSTPLLYFYDGLSGAAHKPLNNVNVNDIPLITNAPNPNCSTAPPCDFPCTEHEILGIANLFHQHKANWKQLK